MIAEIILNLETPGSGQITGNTGGGSIVESASLANAEPYVSLITSEHNQKPNFMAMVAMVTAAIGDVNEGIQAIGPAFDLDSAVGVQLDIVGLWIGQPRIVPNVLLFGFFGFADDDVALPFGELTNPSIGGRFYELGETYSSTTILSDPDYLTILKAQIVRNQSNGTLSAIENALAYIFGVPSYVVDNGTLSLALYVASPVTQTDEAILTGLDILPRPAGVAIGSIVFAGTATPVPPKPNTNLSIIAQSWQPEITWRVQASPHVTP